MAYARKLPLRDRHALLADLVIHQPDGQHDRDRGLRGVQRGADDLPWLGGPVSTLTSRSLYIDYEVIATNYTGWALSEIRAMSARQREYWLKMIKWKRDRVRV